MKRRLLSILLAGAMTIGLLAGCGSTAGGNNTPAGTGTGEGTEAAGSSASSDTPLVAGYAHFNSKFSPFFNESAYDKDAAELTQVILLTNDRQGAIIYKGIEGETHSYNGTEYTYNGPTNIEVTENADGTVYYDIQLREDITFSDGTPMTIDDVIFSMYVYCDPTYDGSSTLFSQPIEGIESYRSGMETRYNLILKAGREGGYTETEFYTEEQYNAFWTALDAAGEAFAQEIVDYCIAAGYGTDVTTSAAAWGYEGLAEDATVADFFAAIVEKYGYDLSDEGINLETAGTSITSFLTERLSEVDSTLMAGVQTGESADSISGIQKIDEYNVRVVFSEVSASGIYQFGFAIAPMHYYGDASLYDYENNMFGFNKGDLSSVRAKTTQPMGAGPYKFIKFENGVISYEANENYYLGAPKTKYLNLLETTEADKLNGVITGTIDITDPSFNKDVVAAVQKANGGEISGPVITTSLVDNLGYGYIGMNAEVMSVGGVKDSDASKNLRKAFGTIFSVYRDVAIDSYYGELATVINYPISNTSWAAPQSTDEGYKVAFSTDVEGKDIYTSGMSEEEKYEAAKKAALGYLEAAGYTVADGKVTAAPEGASLEYELLIPGGGAGDHPSFMICTLAKEALAEIGINLTVTDLTQQSDLWTAIEAGTCAMWAAAWGATIDPDMYQIYHPEGGSNYMYEIDDDNLTQLIEDARSTTDQNFRKLMYKECLDIIIDWAVEIPVYQRQNAIIFSSERVNMKTVTPDISTFYGWLNEIHQIELN